MSYVAAKSLEVARSFLGYHEGPNNYNRFSAWQGLNPYNPWCASFNCYCAVEGGGFRFPDRCTYGYKGEAYTPTMRDRAVEAGYWRDKSWRAQAGDFVEYDWGNNGVIDHVELVVADDGVRLVTIGGNVSNMVAYRTRDRAYVAGFVALSQSSQAAPSWKVAPMFHPPLEIVARLANPQGGWWEAYDDGRVEFLAPNGMIVQGGMIRTNDRKAFAGRHVATLELRWFRPKGSLRRKAGFTIIATSGERYVPEAQH